MKLFANIFDLILYQPLLNVLILLYQYLPFRDFGVAIIFLTILIKFLIYPLEVLAIKNQKALSQIQPKIKEIQEKYKEDKEKQVEETVKIFQKEKINPFSGILSLLIQLPILIALYRVFWLESWPKEMIFLYSFVPNPESIDPTFLDKINLTKPYFLLAILASLAQFFQLRIAQSETRKLKTKDKTSKFEELIQKEILYLFPLLTILILSRLPSALSLYWLVASIFSIVQQYLVFKKI